MQEALQPVRMRSAIGVDERKMLARGGSHSGVARQAWTRLALVQQADARMTGHDLRGGVSNRCPPRYLEQGAGEALASRLARHASSHIG